MKLSELVKTTTRGKKRQGQGRGSGKGGHTSGRGQKGQNSRGKVALLFEGTKIKKSLLKRLPLMRGRGRHKSLYKAPVIVNLKYLNLLPGGSVVDADLLIKEGIVGKEARTFGVKILGDGQLQQNLTVKLPVSKKAKIKIEKAGGEVIGEEPKKEIKARKQSSKTG
ncbi:MAG: 50S ribosomal protein L15 [bacterium]|nr:50S ribosomal protein L15 [bacterium]